MTKNNLNKKLRILFLSINESATLTNLRTYLRKRKDAGFGYMIFGLPITKDNCTFQDIRLSDSYDRNSIVDRKVSLNIVFGEPFSTIFKFIVHLYAFLILLKKIRKDQYDICIAETSTLGLFAWIMKKAGYCRMSIFFEGDIYLPAKNVLGTLYILIQRLFRKISYQNDIIWYINNEIKKWDEKKGFKPRKYFIRGIFSFNHDRVTRSIRRSKKKFQICYIGRMDRYSGLDISIKSIKYIKKKIPEINLLVIGGYSDNELSYYKKLAKFEKINDSVNFTGYIKESKKIKELIAESSLGMGVYSPDSRNGALYSEPGKIRDYLEGGIPVVISKNGPTIVKVIRKYHAGIITEYDPKDVANKIIKVLLNTEKYRVLQKGVAKLTSDRSCLKFLPQTYKMITDSYESFLSGYS